jgi:hypothetical protein
MAQCTGPIWSIESGEGRMNQVVATILLAELRRLGKEMGDEVVLEDAWLRSGVTSKP